MNDFGEDEDKGDYSSLLPYKAYTGDEEFIRTDTSEEEDTSSAYRAEVVSSDNQFARQLQEEEYKRKEKEGFEKDFIREQVYEDNNNNNTILSKSPLLNSNEQKYIGSSSFSNRDQRYYHHHPSVEQYTSPVLPQYASPTEETEEHNNDSRSSVFQRLSRSTSISRENRTRQINRYGAISTSHPFYRAPPAQIITNQPRVINEVIERNHGENELETQVENSCCWRACC